ncbi:MAG: DNA-binding protein [Alphaproteobacteria bacterium HGW-Alphaproteobacteria-12]|nr:MAG: DNA-binding protein [Alphaproteobacteria bacterium HGW-Alphaproteobacteria-12]
MALFFDQEWFDAKLREAGRTRDDVASVLGLSRAEVEEIWKDQRELASGDVSILAGLLAASSAEVANKAGISTPVPAAPARDGGDASVTAKLDAMDARLARIERAVADLQSLILATRNS